MKIITLGEWGAVDYFDLLNTSCRTVLGEGMIPIF
jgi:hypothetical protein